MKKLLSTKHCLVVLFCMVFHSAGFCQSYVFDSTDNYYQFMEKNMTMHEADTGHFPMLERPEEWSSTVLEFLS